MPQLYEHERPCLSNGCIRAVLFATPVSLMLWGGIFYAIRAVFG